MLLICFALISLSFLFFFRLRHHGLVKSFVFEIDVFDTVFCPTNSDNLILCFDIWTVSQTFTSNFFNCFYLHGELDMNQSYNGAHVPAELMACHTIQIQLVVICLFQSTFRAFLHRVCLYGLCHSFFSDTASVYLSDLLRVYSPSRQLRSSSDSRTLCIPHIKTKTFGNRSFSHAAPSVWNSLPHDIRHSQSVTAF